MSKNKETTEKRCAIIGAGASGLTSTRWALAYGIEPVVFEKTDSIGGLWRYNPNEKEAEFYSIHIEAQKTGHQYSIRFEFELGSSQMLHHIKIRTLRKPIGPFHIFNHYPLLYEAFYLVSGVMISTTANTSKEMSAFSDFPPSEDTPVFMRNADMLRYIRAYAEHHHLTDHIRFCHTVKIVRRAEDYAMTGNWIVHYRNDIDGVDHMETFDAVLICHGNQKPVRHGIERKNWEQFRGKILHACEVKNARNFVGTKNVVVGFKSSATDIAVELSRVADKVYISTRSGGFALTRTSQGGGGKPLDMMFARFNKYVLGRLIPLSLQEKILKSQYLAGFDHEKCGLAQSSDSIMTKGITVSDELAGCIMCGAVVLRPDIAEYTSTGVRWTDGTSVDGIDNVIFASGYVSDITVLEEGQLVPSEEGHMFLYQNIFPPQLADHNTLGFIHISHVFGSLMPTFELMARCFFEQFAGVSRLPSKDEMTQIVANERQEAYNRARKTGSPLRLQLMRDSLPFWDALSNLIGCEPYIWRTFAKDPRLAWALCFGPNAPYVYRLRGPHTWPGARDAILGIQRRVEYPLMQSHVASKPEKCKRNTELTMFGVIVVVIIFSVLIKLVAF